MDLRPPELNLHAFLWCTASGVLKNDVFQHTARDTGMYRQLAGCKPLKMGVFRKPRCRTGRSNVATKSPGANLDNAEGVGPQGRGQDARVNRRDTQERRSKDDVEKDMDDFFNSLLEPHTQSIKLHTPGAALTVYCASSTTNSGKTKTQHRWGTSCTNLRFLLWFF